MTMVHIVCETFNSLHQTLEFMYYLGNELIREVMLLPFTDRQPMLREAERFLPPALRGTCSII